MSVTARSLFVDHRHQNMARDDAGAPVPFAGRTSWCDISPTSFWDGAYAASKRTARVVLRRRDLLVPGGVAVLVDCGPGQGGARWDITEIYVR